MVNSLFLSFKRLDLQNNDLKQAYLKITQTQRVLKHRSTLSKEMFPQGYSVTWKKNHSGLWFFFEETFKTQKSANTSGSELKANQRNPTRTFQVEAELY